MSSTVVRSYEPEVDHNGLIEFQETWNLALRRSSGASSYGRGVLPRV